KDTFGPIEVPAERLWGAQTQRSLTNFRISTEKMPPALIKALAQVKRAAAQVNMDLRVLDPKKGRAIIEAADEVIAGKHDGEFPLAVWQTGSGTQTNMNMNEVLANRASAIAGARRGGERIRHREASLQHLRELAIGGTAVGTGLNTHPEFGDRVAAEISRLTGHPFTSAANKFEALAAHDALVFAHGALKTLAASMTKIANDVRWLASGPRCGLGEIK